MTVSKRARARILRHLSKPISKQRGWLGVSKRARARILRHVECCYRRCGAPIVSKRARARILRHSTPCKVQRLLEL